MTIQSKTSIAVIICSTRKPRICPQVASFVLSTIKSSSIFADSPHLSISTVDLVDFNLPLFDESIIPVKVTSVAGYDHEHTRRWSKEISQHQGFIFVTPQYNWGYPASIKNAIDYLFHEWTGKPALVVSYGGHGGGKAAVQLKEVLVGIKMRPVATSPALSYAGSEEAQKAFEGKPLDLEKWEGEKEGLVASFGELVELLRVKA